MQKPAQNHLENTSQPEDGAIGQAVARLRQAVNALEQSAATALTRDAEQARALRELSRDSDDVSARLDAAISRLRHLVGDEPGDGGGPRVGDKPGP